MPFNVISCLVISLKSSCVIYMSCRVMSCPVVVPCLVMYCHIMLCCTIQYSVHSIDWKKNVIWLASSVKLLNFYIKTLTSILTTWILTMMLDAYKSRFKLLLIFFISKMGKVTLQLQSTSTCSCVISSQITWCLLRNSLCHFKHWSLNDGIAASVVERKKNKSSTA